MTRPRYTYRVVTSNGHGIHGREFTRCSDAKASAARQAATPDSLGPYEIERVLHLPDGSRYYWMRRRTRWVPWAPRQGADVRLPDWIYGAVR